MFAGIRPC